MPRNLDFTTAIEQAKNDNGDLAKLYLMICEQINELEHHKDAIYEHLERNLVENNQVWGECEVATFGMTEPKPSTKIDKKAWEIAVADSIELNALELEYLKAQMPFMIDATQNSRPFIRRKRTRNE